MKRQSVYHLTLLEPPLPSTMSNNGYCYLDSCNGTMKKEPEVTQNCNRLTMNSSLFPATSTTANNTTANLTKQLFNRDTNADHPMVTKADYDADLKYGIKVFMNNNTIIANNNNNSNTSSNSIASDEDVEDDYYENYEDEVDDNDSGIVTSTTTAVTADRVDMSNRHCGIMANSMAAESDNNDDSNNNDDDSSTSTTTTITTSNSGSCSSTATATTSKTNHYNNHNGPRKLRFAVGQDVLARWNDGLFYLGNILKIDEKASKCFVQFEDNSEFWVMFKDIQRGAKEGEIMCCSCQGESSDVPDEIVLCDNCGLGYHQLCHNPPIDTNVLNPDVEWLCRLCVFASTVKRGGALKSGPNAQALQLMKQSLPYDMNMLTWDTHHKTNLEQSYCYCGGPGDWYMKMLQCCRCRMWFHEACIQCLDQPLLYGDRFYLFVCSFCNSGPEYLKRIQLKWVDIAQLALFNLCISYQKKYYDLDKVIMPWIYMNRENLQLDAHLETHLRNEVKEKVLETLRSHKKRFQCGREIKKSRSLWGLRLRLPPSPPTIDLPIEGQITDEVMSNLQMKGRKIKTFVPVECQSPIRLKRKAASLDIEESLLLKSKKPAVNGTKSNYSQRKAVTHCTLDSIIPPLPSFEGLNHPFKTDLEQKMEREKKKLKEKILTLYQNGFDPAKHLTNEIKALKPQPQPKPPQKQKGRRKAGSVKLEPPAPATTEPDTVNNKMDTDTQLSNTDPSTADCLKQLKSSDSDYINMVNRLSKRETFHVLARRHIPEGKVQYLVQWGGMLS